MQRVSNRNQDRNVRGTMQSSARRPVKILLMAQTPRIVAVGRLACVTRFADEDITDIAQEVIGQAPTR